MFIPGVNELDETLKKYGYVRILEPESAYDDLSPNDQTLREKAFIYIKTFNQTIRAHLQKQVHQKEGPA